MISNMTFTFVFVPVQGAVAHVIWWFYSVVDKCFECLPRGPANITARGDFEESELTFGSGDTCFDYERAGFGEKIRNSMKLVDMRSAKCFDVDAAQGKRDKKIGKSENDYNPCAVCLADFFPEEPVYKLPLCDHIFHSACLNSWVDHGHNTCPLCRTSLVRGFSGTTPSNINQDAYEEGLPIVDDPRFSFGIWLVSLWAKNFDIPYTSSHSMTWLAGF